MEASGSGGGAHFTNSRFESNKDDSGGQFYDGQHYLYVGSTKLMAL